jgi:hypothetical protein
MKNRNNNNVLRSLVVILGISLLIVWRNFLTSNKPPQQWVNEQWVSVEETQHPIARNKGRADEFSSDLPFRTTRQIEEAITTVVPDKKIIESSAPSMNPLTLDKRKKRFRDCIADDDLLQAFANNPLIDIAKVVHASPHSNNIFQGNDNHQGCLCPAAFNPDSEGVLYRHHELICELQSYAISVPFNAKIVREVNGVEANVAFDCPNWRYGVHHLSRVYPCRIHVALNASHYSGNIYGAIPIVDEEYFEWIDNTKGASEAIARLTKNANSPPAYFGEWGARYGTWAVRAAQSFRALGGGERFVIQGVEGDPISTKWMYDHVAANGIKSSQYQLEQACLTLGGVDMSIQWEGSQSSHCQGRTIEYLLRNVEIMDILHIDVQGAEKDTVPAEFDILSKKVRRIHMGTHGAEVHAKMLETFKSWRVEWNYVGGGLSAKPTITPYGPVRFNDGVLGVVNPALDHLY